VKALIGFAFILFSADSFASLSKTELRFGSTGKREFTTNSSEQWTISSDCVSETGKLKTCAASRALKKVNHTSRNLSGGLSEFYGYLCHLTDGESIAGRDSRGSESKICRYSDNSMIFANSLFAHTKESSQVK